MQIEILNRPVYLLYLYYRDWTDGPVNETVKPPLLATQGDIYPGIALIGRAPTLLRSHWSGALNFEIFS